MSRQTLVPLRVDGVVVAGVLNEKGEQEGEVELCAIRVWKPQFDELAAIVERDWSGHVERFEAHQAQAAAPAEKAALARSARAARTSRARPRKRAH